MLELPTYADAIILIGTAIGSGFGAIKINNKRNNKENNRPKVMSAEAKEVTEKMWDKLQLKSICETKHEGTIRRLEGIEDRIKGIDGKMDEAGKDIKGILVKLRR